MTSARPFQGMTPRNWLNLGLAALFAFYVAQVALDVLWQNVCGHLGTDYCAFWSAGRVATEYGYAAIYNLKLLRHVQLLNFPPFGDRATFAVSPIAYLPLFMTPFQLFALLTPSAGFWLWTLINTTALVGYLVYFHRRTQSSPLGTRSLALILLSLPVYWNLLDGQVNVWLTICLGEFLRGVLQGRSMRAGLWMGGLLLKPQVLLLLVPVVLVRGSRRMITGLLLSCFAILGISVVMAGPSGTYDMIGIWLGFTRGLPTNDVDSMMNWRMIGYYLSMWIPGILGWIVIAAGSLLTVVATIRLWRQQTLSKSPRFAATLLGTLAATALIGWHSHVHTAMVVIPALILSEGYEWFRSRNVLEKWTLIPASAYVGVYALAILIKLGILPGGIASSINVVRGGATFGINLWILGLVLKDLRAPSSPRTTQGDLKGVV